MTMSNNPPVSFAVLSGLLLCDADAGLLFWKERPADLFENAAAANRWNGRYAEKPAFATNFGPYLGGRILTKPYRTHTIVYAMAIGEWPAFIDHVNGDKRDNRIGNLRCVTQAENNRNMPRYSTNSSGHANICRHSVNGNWVVQLRNKHIGSFTDLDAAIAARDAAKLALGFHANHGRVAHAVK